jgi:hypothetical protein
MLKYTFAGGYAKIPKMRDSMRFNFSQILAFKLEEKWEEEK